MLACGPVAIDTRQASVVSLPHARASDAGRLRVLVAEDDRDMNAVLTEALAADGYEVVGVSSGTDALAAFFGKRAPAPDLAVMDVRMPGLSGMQVLAALHKSGALVPVIIITAFGEDALHREALALGAVRVFDKPFDVDELRAAVRELSVKHEQADRG